MVPVEDEQIRGGQNCSVIEGAPGIVEQRDDFVEDCKYSAQPTFTRSTELSALSDGALSELRNTMRSYFRVRARQDRGFLSNTPSGFDTIRKMDTAAKSQIPPKINGKYVCFSKDTLQLKSIDN